MPAKKANAIDYESLSAANALSAKNGGAHLAGADDVPTLKSAAKSNREKNDFALSPRQQSLTNPNPSRPLSVNRKNEIDASAANAGKEISPRISVETASAAKSAAEDAASDSFQSPQNSEFSPLLLPEQEEARGKLPGQKKREKKDDRDRVLLTQDRWLARNGHSLTYAGIFLFTLVVYFRPYELIPALSGLSSIALVIALATLLVYLPTQLTTEGTLTILSTEVKCVLFLAFWAVLTMPIAKDPGLAWETFNESFSKIALIFVVMVNTVRTQARVKALMWLAVGVGVMLSVQALDLYRQGIFKIEGYRVNVDFGGMFGNPNDMAIHLVIFTPIAVALGIASKNKVVRLACFASAALMVGGNMVTLSRGGFLGLLATAAVLVWKLGKRQRFKVVLVSSFFGFLTIMLAPGSYGVRILSIFIPSLDPVGSSDQRKELLEQSILVTLRNPFGIGLGNFPVVSNHGLQTHNAYTQVSSELGWLALAAYVILMVSPIRKLGAVERQMFAEQDFSWVYYLSIGVQASIVGYMVSSFFGPVAYNWFVYFPIAYAVCLRRIYQVSRAEKQIDAEAESRLHDYFNFQKT